MLGCWDVLGIRLGDSSVCCRLGQQSDGDHVPRLLGEDARIEMMVLLSLGKNVDEGGRKASAVISGGMLEY